jgi:hypothetical protein
MSKHARRRSDRITSAPPEKWKHAWVDEAAWLDRCARRIREVDPKVSRDEAHAVAREMLAFERTGVMDPDAAIELLVRHFRAASPARLERRRPEGSGSEE